MRQRRSDVTRISQLSGAPPRCKPPRGATDTQTHTYRPGYRSAPGGLLVPTAPPDAAEYRRVMAWLGLDRVVITQGAAHLRDNANLAVALAEMGDCARGGAVIDGATSEADMQRLRDAGVRGARIMDLPGGAIGLAHLAEVDARAAVLGWCVAV
ncbi:MAG: D-galactarolactone isomerase [Paracoccaceae bacterium]|jgi:D-galactarolactone isomerase